MGNKRNHGGRRKGAGRKRIPGTLTYSVKITPEQAKLLKLWGGGNMSAAIRWLVDTVAPMINRAEDPLPLTDRPIPPPQ